MTRITAHSLHAPPALPLPCVWCMCDLMLIRYSSLSQFQTYPVEICVNYAVVQFYGLDSLVKGWLIITRLDFSRWHCILEPESYLGAIDPLTSASIFFAVFLDIWGQRVEAWGVCKWCPSVKESGHFFFFKSESWFQNYLFSMENPQICLSRVFFSLRPNQGLLQPPVHNILCVYVCLLRGRNDNALKASMNWILGRRSSLTIHRRQTLTQKKRLDAFSSEVPSAQLWPCG